MRKPFLIHSVIVLSLLFFQSCTTQNVKNNITPNQFRGTDIERIQAAIDRAAETTSLVIIPSNNSNDSGLWLIDSAILLPSDITVILKNCTIQLSDKCRDNMFRSDNVGQGITKPKWNQNIKIIGIGDVLLEGADNPRATGDASKKLRLDPTKEIKETGSYHISYGTDAGKKGAKQMGDWRNIMILMAYVDGFIFRNVTIKNAHAWSVSNERVRNAEISNIRIYSPPVSIIDSVKRLVRNRDGIDIRNGCKNFRMNNISGRTGDDFIAFSILRGLGKQDMEAGILNSTMVTTRKWRGSEDDIENIFITNIACQSDTRAIAIRANDVASINHVYINGVISEGGYNVILLSGRGYGSASKPGKINNIQAMNIMGDGSRSLIQIDAPIADCSFMNGLYTGDGEHVIFYKIEQSKIRNIDTLNLIKSGK